MNAGKVFLSCDSCYPGYLLSDGRCESMCEIGQYPVVKDSDPTCEDCDDSCQECQGPGLFNCTSCSAKAILEVDGRCLPCCRHDKEWMDMETPQQECCNCTETRGHCIFSTNLPFTYEEYRGNLTIFIIASVLLVLVLIGVIFLIRHSRSKSGPSDLPPRGYKKLGGGFGGGSRYGGYTSASSTSYSSSGGRFQEAELVDMSTPRSWNKNDDDDDDDDDEDIVYMGKDGTVYRKFRYGQLGDDNEDELEYDDESYTFR
ncbi:hypothetical protein CHARACLAT_025228 [Characodon lateralis]|uniref:Proprotein convertase subtilisin/kexin type 5 n=1 Tax=Characodon lateralis TaxID=208331 RepID=A0ABU7EM37_9TELE|nr:hypothetical protein [Characodon lateralis]